MSQVAITNPFLSSGSPPARALAGLSAIVYRPWDEAEQALNALGYTLKAIFDHRGTQGMLVHAETFASITFRGTEASRFDVRDVVANLTWPWPLPWMGEGRVHSGYKDAFAMIACEAIDMAKQVPSDLPLYVDGHSMGGALATLFASYYGSTFPDWNLAGLVTYGATKTVNRTAARAITCRKWRLVIPWDFAQGWPPVFGLTHPSPAIRLEWTGGGNPLARHDVENYITALAAVPLDPPQPARAE